MKSAGAEGTAEEARVGAAVGSAAVGAVTTAAMAGTEKSVMGVMMAAGRAWTLERSDRRLVFASGDEMTVFAEDGAFRVARHREPAWKVVLGVGGPVEAVLGGGRRVGGAGLAVPPETEHVCAAAGSYTAFFVDPWLLRPAPGPVPLGAGEVRRLLAALGSPVGGGSDTSAAFAELTRVTGAGAALDPRVEYAVRASMRDGDGAARIGTIAAEAGLSPVRLRALVGRSVGVPLVRLRSWARLRAAIGRLGDGTVADAAAAAGFADQAHFTRTAGGLLGRPPGSLHAETVRTARTRTPGRPPTGPRPSIWRCGSGPTSS
ncbi:hypothetical protein GCM10009605_60120 [Nocardiopsis composta]